MLRKNGVKVTFRNDFYGTKFSVARLTALTVGLAGEGQYISVVDLTLMEDGEAATIDVVRMRNILESYSVQLEEVEDEDAYMDSAWDAGQYQVAGGGLVMFAAGQSRARTTISASSDELRERDRVILIRIHEVNNNGEELARIRLLLEDDDRR